MKKEKKTNIDCLDNFHARTWFSNQVYLFKKQTELKKD